jgi:hypothetical protein
MITGFVLSAAAQAQLQVRVPEGRSAPGSIGLANKCKETHLFRASLKNDAGYIRFKEQADSVRIKPASKKNLDLVFDAAHLEQGVYRGVVQWECIDCKDKRKCVIPAGEVSYEMTVIELPEISQLASKYRTLLNEVLNKAGAVMDDDARTEVHGILKQGASLVIKSGAEDRIEESYENVKKFAEALVSNAEKNTQPSAGNSFAARSRWNAPVVITISSVRKALAAVCPLFPFCK